MKNRFEFMPIFQLFHKELKTQFGQKIFILQFDNAKENVSKTSFSSHLFDKGIIHKTTYPHTPYQNMSICSKLAYMTYMLQLEGEC